jgi:hypothetical protein
MSLCRVCGADCLPDELLPDGGCHRCHGMPACGCCGHPHRLHHGRCDAPVAADGGLTVGRCGCPGYTVAATAAELEPTVLRLRRPGEPLPAS